MVMAGRTDPWFLSARHSVLQRAVLTSVALSVLGAVAGVIGAWAAVLLALLARSTGSGPSFGTAFVLGVCVAGMILWYWQGAAISTIAWRALLLVFVADLPALAGFPLIGDVERLRAIEAGIQWVSRWPGEGDHLSQQYALWLMLCWLGLSAANLGRCRTWFVSALVSALCVPLAFPILHSAKRISEVIGDGSGLVDVLALLMFLGQTMALLFIPWGLPWWFRPRRDSVEGECDGLVAPSVALDPHASAGGTGPT